MAQPQDVRQKDLLRPALESIIDLRHPLPVLAGKIDWAFIEKQLGGVYKPGAGHPPLPIRLMAGLLILKHTYSLSDDGLCDRWIENPYFQYFCGEQVFQHELQFDRSSLTRWRQRLGDERLAALLQESLRVAHSNGALATKDLERVVVDTTVQPKAIAHPTDARLTHKAIEKLVDFAAKHGIKLRQTYVRVAKRAAIMAGRYIHAHQFKRANAKLKFLRFRLSRVIRDINRKVGDNKELKAQFAPLLSLVVKVRHQDTLGCWYDQRIPHNAMKSVSRNILIGAPVRINSSARRCLELFVSPSASLQMS